MVDRRARQRVTRAAWTCALWVVMGLSLSAVPEAWRTAAAQALVLPALIFAWRGGTLEGAVHGLVGGALAYGLAAGPAPEATVIGGLGTLQGLLTTPLLGAATGLLSDRVLEHMRRRRESEERYVLAARGAHDGLWDWNVREGRVYYSERWCEILGYQLDEVKGRPEDWLERVHPADAAEVEHGLRAHMQGESPRFASEHRVRRQDGSWAWVQVRGLCSRDADGTPRRMAGWLSDISEQKQTEQRLNHYAFHDGLTGLPNRALFMDRVSHALARLKRTPERTFAVFMLDLDRFKNVNDSIGHLAGDELLCQVARRLETCVGESDTVARLGGDEFTLLAEQITDAAGAEQLASLVQRSISAPIRLEGHDVVTSTSIGVVLGSAAVSSPLSLLRDADQAMYRAKQQGKGQHVVFDERVHDEASQRLSLETALRTALDTQALHVEYQPVVDLQAGRIAGFEAFARWSHPTLGPISPKEFIRLAEETGLVGRLGQSVLGQALEALSEWNRELDGEEPYRMGVNVSTHELRGGAWLDHARTLLREHGLSPRLLGVEVTEHSLMQDAEAGQQALGELRDEGIRIYLDDFGTGYSSLSYLHRFTLDAIKVDGAFVGKLHEGRGAEEIVGVVVDLAKDLGLRVVAEGTERQEHVTRLRNLGCHEAQGFFFGAPTSRAEITAMLRAQRS